MYHFTTKIHGKSFEEAIEHVTAELKKEGFGIITKIDMKSALKEKINVDFRNYTILGACNPKYAYQAILEEDKIGVFLPCNVVVQENAEGTIEISAVDPVASMMAVENKALIDAATSIQTKLKLVIDRLTAPAL